MRSAIRLMIGGVAAVIVGIAWVASDLRGGDPSGVFTGGAWKGPLLIITGLAAVFMGWRLMQPEAPRRSSTARTVDQEAGAAANSGTARPEPAVAVDDLIDQIRRGQAR